MIFQWAFMYVKVCFAFVCACLFRYDMARFKNVHIKLIKNSLSLRSRNGMATFIQVIMNIMLSHKLIFN